MGGTEVYVAGLATALKSHGLISDIAAPAYINQSYDYNGIPVHRFAQSSRPAFAHAYGEPDEAAAASFRELVSHLRPRIIHLHARTSAVSERLVDVSHEMGAKVVFTYHTPTSSCVRGTMMWMGRQPCNGRLNTFRCTACNLAPHGVPVGLRQLLASVPAFAGRILDSLDLSGGLWTAMRMSTLVGDSHQRFYTLMRKVDRVVAVCDWVADLLCLNGVPKNKLVLSRQGLMRAPSLGVRPKREPGQALRLVYFGRTDWTKGIDILIQALAQIPKALVTLHIYGVNQNGSERYFAGLRELAANDSRITFHTAIGPEDVVATMQSYDLVAIPSRCLETGPLVVLEAFAAGTPVLGARLGGIAELVTHNVDGILIPPDDPSAWAVVIGSLAAAPEQIEGLRWGIRPPRTMKDAAAEMAALYRELLNDATT
jgi:glycosyltransferase involved in cell wall biosynthesis